MSSVAEAIGRPGFIITTPRASCNYFLPKIHKPNIWNYIHPHNNPVKAIIFSNFKILQNDPETGAILSQPPLISFKNVGNFLVKSTFKTIEKPGTFKCARSLSSKTLTKYRALSDLLRSLIVSRVPRQMLSIA